METRIERADEGVDDSRWIVIVLSEPSPSYIVGIDLGTTNCAVAFADPAQGADAPVVDFPIPQLQRPGEVAALPLLAIVPLRSRRPRIAARLDAIAVGRVAQADRGRVRPLAGSARARTIGGLGQKLAVSRGRGPLRAHSAVGRAAGVVKVSPVAASALLLAHMAAAWNAAHPDAPMAQQEVVITVPASFDEVARALTVNAARQAGLEKFTLVEEPQAAFYDFTAHHRHDLAERAEGRAAGAGGGCGRRHDGFHAHCRRALRPTARPCGASRSAII